MIRPEVLKNIMPHLPKGIRRRLPKNINVAAVSAKESQKLNRRYRGKRKAANVLSFRYGPGYGEIIVCPEVIRRDAKKTGRPYRRETKRMITHGLLHLAGLHHEKSPKARKKFEQVEQKVLSRFVDS